MGPRLKFDLVLGILASISENMELKRNRNTERGKEKNERLSVLFLVLSEFDLAALMNDSTSTSYSCSTNSVFVALGSHTIASLKTDFKR